MFSAMRRLITSPIAVSTAAMAVLAIILLLFATGGGGRVVTLDACPSRGPVELQVSEGIGMIEFFGIVKGATTCPGYVLHLRSEGERIIGEDAEEDVKRVFLESWLDGERALMRSIEISPRTTERVVTREGAFTVDDGRSISVDEHPACASYLNDLSSVFFCSDSIAWMFSRSLDDGVQYRGRSAYAIVAPISIRENDVVIFRGTFRTYIDAETFLPLGRTEEATVQTSPDESVPIGDFPFEYEFISRDSLPADFFEPASIGWIDPQVAYPEDPEVRLDRIGATVYWLGREFIGNSSLPELTLDAVYGTQIVYRRTGDERGFPAVVLQIFTPEQWARISDGTGGDCWLKRDVLLDDRRATVRLGYHFGGFAAPGESCPPRDKAAATVIFEDAVIQIGAPVVGTDEGNVYSPYDTEGGMDLLLRSLELRTVDE